VSNNELHNTSKETILREDFFNEGVVPPYNPPLTNPLRLVLIQVAPVPIMSSTIPTSNIPPHD